MKNLFKKFLKPDSSVTEELNKQRKLQIEEEILLNKSKIRDLEIKILNLKKDEENAKNSSYILTIFPILITFLGTSIKNYIDVLDDLVKTIVKNILSKEPKPSYTFEISQKVFWIIFILFIILFAFIYLKKRKYKSISKDITDINSEIKKYNFEIERLEMELNNLKNRA